MNNVIFAHEHITIDLAGFKNDPDCRLDDRAAALNDLRRHHAAHQQSDFDNLAHRGADIIAASPHAREFIQHHRYAVQHENLRGYTQRAQNKR